jgi:hypothetical protein
MLIDQIRHIAEESGIDLPVELALVRLAEAGYLIYDKDENLLNEGILKKALGVGALAAGLAFGNSNVAQKEVQDDSFGKGSKVHVQLRKDLPHDKYGVPTSYTVKDKSVVKGMSLKDEIELTKKKILSTPDSMLKKEGKENVDKIAKYITTTANKYNIDVDILLAMAGTESNYKHAGTVSNKGARGIMQITPIAAKDAHVRLQGGSEKTFDFDDMLDLKKNIDVAGRKLADLSKTHNNVIEMMLAAYNGGRRQATAWRAYKANSKFDKNGGKAPALTKETRQYVERCLMLYKLYKKINKSA